MNEYNYALCEERHEKISKEFDNMDTRIKKVENRFIAIMTALILNLLGVVATLSVMISQAQ